MKQVFHSNSYSRGDVEFWEFDAAARPLLFSGQWDQAAKLLIRKFHKKNLVFNYPRAQYAALDRGGTPEAVNANWLTLAATNYTDPAVQMVTGETFRVQASTKAVDPSDPKSSIFRFILDVGQFVGSWSSAILIGGPTATSTPGTGKIVAAVNNVVDETNTPLSRTGTSIHIVNWKLKHLDSSEA